MATLYRGDDAKNFITINLATTVDVTITKAVFQCRNIRKEFNNPAFPLVITLTAAETKSLADKNDCYLAVWDEDGLKQTCEGTLEFATQSQVVT